MIFHIYVLKSLSARKSYVGMTSNLETRLKQHNSGLHAYTKKYVPWVIVHTELCGTLIDARAREKYLKSAAGRRFLKTNVFKN